MVSMTPNPTVDVGYSGGVVLGQSIDMARDQVGVVRLSSAEAEFVGAFTASTAKPWVCIHHRSDDGARVRLALRREGAEVHWPRYIDRKPKRDDVIRPLFPGYMFAQGTAKFGSALMKAIPNVIGVVGVRERGRPDPCDPLVRHLLSRAGSMDGVIDETPDALPARKFQRGEPVTVASGPFAGLQGLMRSEDRGQARVQVLLAVLGGESVVEMGREALV